MHEDPDQRPSFYEIYRELQLYQKELMSKVRIRNYYEDIDGQYTSVIFFDNQMLAEVRKEDQQVPTPPTNI
jgi:hypothetical protein